ncbi:MAG TPA: glycosyltransferase [Casimicrobiaceae bacterium]|nr:glycosyltransferase [Casimicrobiaceae bacterium]
MAFAADAARQMVAAQGKGALMAIDVVVPVYNAPQDVRKCVESVLAHTSVAHSLVLIDDASTNAGVREYFDELAQRQLPHLVLLYNEHNLGFTGTANRGMTRSDADIVLLNSDTIVTSGWLDALLRCAASDERIGTITPFSNNAEIASFPKLCGNHRWPDDVDPEPLRAAIAQAAVPCYPDIPTGVGFCMFVRRALIRAIGTFDAAFGAGYGEENDLCMRAQAAGWRNVLCDDCFVLHTGGRSFDGAKAHLTVHNSVLLNARHPRYSELVADFIARDPLSALREAARTAFDRMHGPKLGVLHILHGGGGTEAYVRSLARATQGSIRHTLATVRADTWNVEELRTDGSVMHCQFARRDDEAPEDFLRMVCAVYGASVVHVHNISGSREQFQRALPVMTIPYVITVHDLNFACPTITLHKPDGFFCGGVTDPVECNACLGAQRGYEGIDIVRWRADHAPIVAAAAAVIAPSRWAASLLQRYFPDVHVHVVPHALSQAKARHAVQVVLMPAASWSTVAIVGAIGPDKGARRVEKLAALAAARNAPVRFVVIGYLDRRSNAWQSEDGRLTVHGRYDARDLPKLFEYYDVSLVLYPSSGPESFAFTLSETWSAGRPVLVPPIGALVERVTETGAGWVMSDDEWRDESMMLDRVVALVSRHATEDLEATARRASAVQLPTLASMVDATVDIWQKAAGSARVTHVPIEPLRVVEAYGYRRWAPPADVTDAPPLPVAERSAATRRSRIGRVLRRLMAVYPIDAPKTRSR